jgi:hypothetical protein
MMWLSLFADHREGSNAPHMPFDRGRSTKRGPRRGLSSASFDFATATLLEHSLFDQTARPSPRPISIDMRAVTSLREVAAGPQLRDRQIDRAGPGSKSPAR